MNEQKKRTIWAWLGDITNLAALLAIAIVVVELFKDDQSKLIIVLAFCALIFIILLKYADMARFREMISSQEGFPPSD